MAAAVATAHLHRHSRVVLHQRWQLCRAQAALLQLRRILLQLRQHLQPPSQPRTPSLVTHSNSGGHEICLRLAALPSPADWAARVPPQREPSEGRGDRVATAPHVAALLVALLVATAATEALPATHAARPLRLHARLSNTLSPGVLWHVLCCNEGQAQHQKSRQIQTQAGYDLACAPGPQAWGEGKDAARCNSTKAAQHQRSLRST